MSEKTHQQSSRNSSPWSTLNRALRLLWNIAWFVFCAWTPKPLYPWRIFWLRIFGAKINGKNTFVHQSAVIHVPWNLTMQSGSCIGEKVVVYNLDNVILLELATVAQESYLCTGTHDFALESKPLKTERIIVGKDSFVGARSFILPGITIGDRAIVGACSVVTKSVPEGAIVAGNPAKQIGVR